MQQFDLTNTDPSVRSDPSPGPEYVLCGPSPAQAVGTTDPFGSLRPASVPISQFSYATNDSPQSSHTMTLYNPVPQRSEQESVLALTRVMSPTNPSNYQLEANQSVLLGLQCQCQICNHMSPDSSLCAQCGVYGHAICIGVELFQGYAFCRGCMNDVLTTYAGLTEARL